VVANVDLTSDGSRNQGGAVLAKPVDGVCDILNDAIDASGFLFHVFNDTLLF
jgi:hypothetical protein